jgi:hypothetical protein
MKNIDQKFSFSILKTFTEKIFTSLLLLFITQQLFAQVQENFDDGSFLENPPWSGDDSLFDASGLKLQLKAPPISGTAYLSTPSTAIINASWEFKITLTFNPSGSNFARIYLVSDQIELSQALNGYFILVGGSSDEISLYKQSGTTLTRLIDGRDGVLNLSNVSCTLKATRDSTGYWNLLSDIESPGIFFSEGTALDVQHLSAAYTGVWCRYTATRADKFFFDDIRVSGSPYIPPPLAKMKDVLITEVFADPSPRQDLPDYEYVEIYNRSKNPFSLQGWTISDGSTSASLPEKILQSGKYLILTSLAAQENFLAYGDVVALAGFPSLNNSGDNVVLKNALMKTVDSIQYNTNWYHDNIKQEGGWSLELIDLDNICGEENNWTAADNEEGGTPGKPNSVASEKPDLNGPEIVSVVPISDSVLLISFNEKLDALEPRISSFNIEPRLMIRTARFSDISLRKIELLLDDKLQPKKIYKLTGVEIYDCAGNVIKNDHAINFAQPEMAIEEDLVINEILFNPRPTGVDFVEVLNRSDKFVNLKNWSIANVDGDQLTNVKVVTTDDFMIAPGAYLVFTTNKDIIKGEYILAHEERILVVAEMPSLPDDDGSIVITDGANHIIDKLQYSQSMHSIFLKDDEGVSLERISPSESADNIQNWKSASATQGFATPGYVNSNTQSESVSVGSVTLDPEIFIPISGQPDFTQIHYQFDRGGKVANVKIFDAQGHLIRELANNFLLGTEGFFRWDGDHANGSKARVGYYMMWFEVFDDTGSVQTFRKRIAIASRF